MHIRFDKGQALSIAGAILVCEVFDSVEVGGKPREAQAESAIAEDMRSPRNTPHLVRVC